MSYILLHNRRNYFKIFRMEVLRHYGFARHIPSYTEIHNYYGKSKYILLPIKVHTFFPVTGSDLCMSFLFRKKLGLNKANIQKLF